MSKWIAASVGVLVAAIVPHAALAQDDAPLEAVVTLHPGPPLGTLPLGVPPRMDRPWVFKQGRPILVSFTITNVSAAEYRFLDAMSFTGRSGDCFLTSLGLSNLSRNNSSVMSASASFTASRFNRSLFCSEEVS